MRRVTRARLSLALLAVLAVFAVGVVRADGVPALDVTTLRGGLSLRRATYVLEDPGGALTFEEIRRLDRTGHFRRSDTDTSFGFMRAAMWVRFDVENPSEVPRTWLLELAYPHLDYIDLYTARADGRVEERRSAGDHLPFASRLIDHASFVFEQTTAPHERTRYYLRVRSEGAMRIPLVAWYEHDFHGHESRNNLLLWMLYGAMVVMAWYNVCVAALVRNREHLYFAGVLLSITGGIATLSGHMFQYVLRDFPELANRSLVFFVALGLLFVQLYVRILLLKLDRSPPELRLYRYTLLPNALLVLFAVLAPPIYGQRGVLLGFMLYMPFGLMMLRGSTRLRDPQLRYTLLSFYSLILALPIALLAHASLIPPYPAFIWAAHIGSAVFSVLASLALPVRLNVMGDRMAGLNARLSANIADLKLALTRAEQASEEARRATRVKDEFMATMSHELRTPLNAIINVPQGLLEDFPTVPSATCASCRTTFELDTGEVVDAGAACPECEKVGTLREGAITRYTGKPAHTAKFLKKIERSGQHLLQMVNGVLDFSKMEAGRFQLSLGEVDMAELLREASDELAEVARARDLELILELADDTMPGLGDAVRLRQVLLNLLTNAIKFSEPGGTIKITWKRDADNDVVSISDKGIGIAPEDHERVFASFEQVHKGDTRKYGGTGLGLSISRSLVRMHGGELWVRSQLGEGATFSFRIPRGHGIGPSAVTSVAS